MLSTNDYIKYNMTLQEYYITLDGVTNNTQYSSDDLNQMKIDAQTLKTISHSVYRLIYNARWGRGKYAHKKYMRKKIYENAEEEVTALMFAMLEAVKGAVESGMDLNAYTNDPKDTLPYTVTQELKAANLIDPTEKIDHDLDFDYTEADLSAAE